MFGKELASIDIDISIIPINKQLYVSLSKRIHFNNSKTIELRYCWDRLNETLPSDVLDIATDSDIKYILEVDLEYPISKHAQRFAIMPRK